MFTLVCLATSSNSDRVDSVAALMVEKSSLNGIINRAVELPLSLVFIGDKNAGIPRGQTDQPVDELYAAAKNLYKIAK
jgi:hypothetical protein